MHTMIGLAFTLPAVLFGIPLILGALWYAYRRGGRGNNVILPTLLLLRQFSRPISAPRKAYFPIRFFIELCILTLILLAAAGISIKDDRPSYAIVIDNSFSMAARVGRAVDGSIPDNLERAKVRAKEYVSAVPKSAQYTVFITSPYVKALSNDPQTSTEVLKTVEDIQVTYAADNLPSAIERLSQSMNFDHVVVFSDRPSSGKQDTTDSTIDYTELFDVRDIATHTSNISLSSLSFVNLRSDDKNTSSFSGDQTLQAEVSWFSDVAKTNKNTESFTVSLQGIIDPTPTAAFNPQFRELERKTIQLAPGQTGRLVFTSKPEFANSIALRATLDLTNQQRDEDAILIDNNLTIGLGSSNNKILVVSTKDKMQLGLGMIPGLDFDVISPDAYMVNVRNSLQLTNSYSAIIFQHYIPDELPAINSMFVAPTNENVLFAIHSIAGKKQITEWNNTHPILNYLTMPLLQLQSIQSLEVPPWAKPLIVTDGGIVSFVGEIDRKRFTAFGFEMLPFEGKKSPFLSILTLNAIRWVSQKNLSSNSLQTYQPVSINAANVAAFHELGAEAVQIESASGKPKQIVSFIPGIVRYALDSNPTQYVAFSFNNIDESNIADIPPVNAFPIRKRTVQTANMPIEIWLLLIVLTILVADILLAIRSVFKNKKANRLTTVKGTRVTTR